MASFSLRLIAAVVLSGGIGYLVTAAAVIDLNFADLAEIVKVHPFLAVAFYSPGCGYCRRILPSWTQAAELIEDQHLPIRLARMDISSRGGMLAWQEFELKRVPAVKVFVGNNIDDPLPYSGHLDASGIVAHLAMLERDRQRLLEQQEKYRNHNSSSRRLSGGVRDADEMGVGESGMTLVALSVPSSTLSSSAEETASLTDTFREAVGHKELSLVFFVADESPKTRRMMAELRKAAPGLAGRDPPIQTVLVDLRSPDNSGSSRGRGDESESRKPGDRSPDLTGLDTASVKRQLVADIGLPVGDFGGQELRIFLDGKPWVEGGIFRGMHTADGILEHMQWVAVEAGLTPHNVLRTAGQEGTSRNCENTATAGMAVTRAGGCSKRRRQ